MRPLVRLTRVIAGAGALTMVMPPILLAGWAAVYLWEVFEYASAPGIPVAFEYEGAGGKVRVRAKSYSVDVGGRLVLARGLEVHGPDGGRVIYVDRAIVRQDEKGGTLVEVQGIDALLDRMPNGDFNFLGTIPKPPEEKGPETVVRVVAKDVVLRYRDRTRKTPITLVGRSKEVRASGVGDGWLAHGVVRFDGVGALPFELVLGEKGAFRADLQLANSEIVPILPVIERYLEKDQRLPLSARSLRGTGNLQLDGTAGGAFRAFGSVRLGALDLVASSYRASTVTGDLNLCGQRLTGNLFAAGSGLRLNADRLTFDWARQVKLVATGRAELTNLRELPADWRKGIPAGIRVTGAKFDGTVGLDGDKWLVQGGVKASEVTAEGERFSNPSVQLVASSTNVAAKILSARWSGVPLTGAVSYTPNGGQLRAFAESKSVNLGPLAKKYNLPLSGRGSLQAIVESAGNKTLVWIGSRGQADYSLPEGRRVGGNYVVQLSGSPQKLNLDQAVLRGPQGALAASGSVNLNARTLDLAVSGGDIEAASFAQDVSGKAYFQGVVNGSFSNPTFATEVDLFKLKVADAELPWLQLQASGNSSRVRFTQMEAQYGFSRVYGDVTLEPKSGKLAGNFRSPGIQLAEFGEGQAAGLIRILNGTVTGTLSKPTIMADLDGGPIAFSGATLGGVQGRLFANSDLIRIAGGKLSVNDADQSGDLTLSGEYRLGPKSGNLQANWTNLPLRPLAQFDERFAVQGLSTGEAALSFTDKGIRDGTVSGSLAEIALNGQVLGSGPFEAVAKNGTWTASGSIGSLERYASLDELKQDANGNLSGKLTSYRVTAESLIRLTRARWKDAPEDVQRFVADLTGVVDGTLAFNVTNGVFGVQTDDLAVSDLSVGGRNVGKLTASIDRTGNSWAVKALTLQNGEEQLTGSGSLRDDGALNFEGEANKIGLSWLNAINPDLAVIPAIADASFLVTGNTDNPNVRASLKVSGIPRGDALEGGPPPSLNLDFIELKDRLLTAEGAFQAEGFTGSLVFSSPLSALVASTENVRSATDQFRLEANVSERQIGEFKDLLTFVDFERSSGTIGGRVAATGNIDKYTLSGGLRYGGTATAPPRLAFADTKTSIENPLIEVALVGDQVQFTASGTSSAGGDMTLEASIPGVFPEGNDIKAWLANTPIQGQVRLNAFKVDEGDASRGNLIQTALSTISKADDTAAPITVSGNLSSPLIDGKVAFSGANADLPEFKPGEGSFEPLVNPRFSIEYASIGPVRVRTLAANFVANASGTVQGSLLRPNATGAFVVREGTLKLPNARIQLEDGGLVSLAMRTDSAGNTTVEVPVSLTGRTSVSARGGGSNYQRYDITIQVNGDLMQQGDLQLLGRSDPPDLSQQEILAIIGQRDLLEALATGAQNTRTGEFRDALIGLFLPTLSDQLTSSLATAFQLDYLALDYNPFEGAMLSGAKSFSRYLTIEGRRALTPTPFVNAVKYELRLVYRIPTKNDLLSRARFVLSTDNLRPYRIAIEYSIKL